MMKSFLVCAAIAIASSSQSGLANAATIEESLASLAIPHVSKVTAGQIVLAANGGKRSLTDKVLGRNKPPKAPKVSKEGLQHQKDFMRQHEENMKKADKLRPAAGISGPTNGHPITGLAGSWGAGTHKKLPPNSLVPHADRTFRVAGADGKDEIRHHAGPLQQDYIHGEGSGHADYPKAKLNEVTTAGGRTISGPMNGRPIPGHVSSFKEPRPAPPRIVAEGEHHVDGSTFVNDRHGRTHIVGSPTNARPITGLVSDFKSNPP